MSKNLGYLTAFGFEDVYDFIGEERMNEKIREYENIPTMGFKLQEFLRPFYTSSFSSGRGPIYYMNLFFYLWFNDDVKIAFYLYEKSKSYSEEDYLEKEPFKSLWEKHIEDTNRRRKKWDNESYFDLEHWENEKANPYWIEYHYFICSIVQTLMKYKRYQEDRTIEAVLTEIYDAYITNSEKIVKRLKIDTRLWSDNGLGSLVFTKVKTFLKWKGEKEKISQIIEKAKNDGWRI